MRLKPNVNLRSTRSYSSEDRCERAVHELLGEDEPRVPYVLMSQPSLRSPGQSRWTAVVFLPEKCTWRAAQIARHGFIVCN